jgi:hypothetical protein
MFLAHSCGQSLLPIIPAIPLGLLLLFALEYLAPAKIYKTVYAISFFIALYYTTGMLSHIFKRKIAKYDKRIFELEQQLSTFNK